MRLEINTGAIKEFTKQLKKLRRYDLPIAIRSTLNDVAFDVKKNTMPKQAEVFKKRQPNFFKANSRVEMAQGFDINKMVSAVGFYENKLKEKSTNYAVKDLEQQEMGGTIKSKSFIALKTARQGGSTKRLVKPNARLSRIRSKGIVNARNSRGKNIKEKFIGAAIAAGKGGFVISGKKQILFQVDSFLSNRKSGKTSLKATPLYSFRRNRKVKVNNTSFMHKASIESAKNMEALYIRNARKRIAKFNSKL